MYFEIYLYISLNIPREAKWFRVYWQRYLIFGMGSVVERKQKWSGRLLKWGLKPNVWVPGNWPSLDTHSVNLHVQYIVYFLSWIFFLKRSCLPFQLCSQDKKPAESVKNKNPPLTYCGSKFLPKEEEISAVLWRGRWGIVRIWLSQCCPVLFQKGGKDLPAIASRGLGSCLSVRDFSPFNKSLNRNVGKEW